VPLSHTFWSTPLTNGNPTTRSLCSAARFLRSAASGFYAGLRAATSAAERCAQTATPTQQSSVRIGLLNGVVVGGGVYSPRFARDSHAFSQSVGSVVE